ncbi:cysteine-rich RECEPTOR-like kinase [Rhynchospora pubera]|uniref:Cysteine-rich RECEPTOR-like kinase n=1 Tax=Rhynchospora pubera TaxID=906938 RepID=A0AAV8GLX5_9POAL|nr:cysteine-rich RECEPTOR-like kinase [Rhynchospora pubera]
MVVFFVGLRSSGDARLFAGAGSVDVVQYRLHDLEKATDYFSDANRLGEGGFGEVYKGWIDKEIVAIKLLHGSSHKLLEDIAKEVSLLSSLNNNNLVKLLGFCSEAGRYLLVYEYIANGDLRGCLVDNKKRKTLNWEKRFKIIEGIARGLFYLHHNSENVIIHRDLKPENILLDEYYTPKIADFGLSRGFETEKTHESTRKLAGTIGYFAPELWFQWQYSTKSDVYSYGLLVLELLAGCTIPRYAQANQKTLSHVMWKQWKEKRPLTEVIDSSLQEDSALEEIARCFVIGLLCVQDDSKKRPDMELVLHMLCGDISLPTPSFPGFFQEYTKRHDPHSPIEFQPTENSRSEDPNIYFEYQPTEQRSSSDNARPEYSRSSELQPSSVKEYSLKDLKIVTDNFYRTLWGNRNAYIKYMGLLDGQTVAVGEYSPKDACRRCLLTSTVSLERKRKYIFFAEAKKIIKMSILPLPTHPNILNMLGYCSEVEEKVFIMYSYPENGLLSDYLFNRDLITPQESEWRTRVKIINGVANGISYLHHGLQEQYIIHRDLEPSNIFLDDSWNAKLKWVPFSTVVPMDEESFIAYRLIRTPGYTAPEALIYGRLSRKSDVYSYGMILLEILSRIRAVDIWKSYLELKDWMYWDSNKMLELLDPHLQNQCPEEEALRYIQIALLCIQDEPEMRPSMQQVLDMLNSDDSLFLILLSG